jgi:hypothetical protein
MVVHIILGVKSRLGIKHAAKKPKGKKKKKNAAHMLYAMPPQSQPLNAAFIYKHQVNAYRKRSKI